MCTAISYLNSDHYFGRNLDLEHSYHEVVTITPRAFPFTFKSAPQLLTHYAMIGMATVCENYPLYYEATNEYGLSMAGLNFPDNAVYHPKKENYDNITPFEFIPWILGQCKNVKDARQRLDTINLLDLPFSQNLPLTPLHWMISDRRSSITVEPTVGGLMVYDNPVGVLTNNPPFDYHMYNLRNYLNLTILEPENRFSNKLELTPYSRGMGAFGLPGDLSSASRFIKATFTKLNSQADDTESSSISQFFHILNAVAQQRGCVKIGEHYEKTIYSSCCNTEKGIYYYTTYENAQITAVNMFHEKLDADCLYTFPIRSYQHIQMEN